MIYIHCNVSTNIYDQMSLFNFKLNPFKNLHFIFFVFCNYYLTTLCCSVYIIFVFDTNKQSQPSGCFILSWKKWLQACHKTKVKNNSCSCGLKVKLDYLNVFTRGLLIKTCFNITQVLELDTSTHNEIPKNSPFDTLPLSIAHIYKY